MAEGKSVCQTQALASGKIGKEEEGRIFYSETNSKEQLTSECNENPWMQQNYVII